MAMLTMLEIGNLKVEMLTIISIFELHCLLAQLHGIEKVLSPIKTSVFRTELTD